MSTRTGLVVAIALAATAGGVTVAYARAPAIPPAVPGNSAATAKTLETTILSVANDAASLNALLTELSTSPPPGYSQQDIYAAIAAASLNAPAGSAASATLSAAASSYLASISTASGSAAVAGASSLASEIELAGGGGGGGGGSSYSGA